MTERSGGADTIVAVATPLVPSAIGVVRLSGMDALSIAASMVRDVPSPREAAVRNIYDNEKVVDQALLIAFKGPASFTGDDVVEFHVHGNPTIALHVQELCVKAGARIANKGEFTLRAVQAKKLELWQAEALGELINSSSLETAMNASQLLAGARESTTFWTDVERDMIAILAQMEAWTDFSEEDIETDSIHQVLQLIEGLAESIQTQTKAFESNRGFHYGVKTVIAGPPNAGKSSLYNVLAGQDRAIVSTIAGTTRDVLDVELTWDGLPIVLVDTAGLRGQADALESIGIQKTQQTLQTADLVVWMGMDSSGVWHGVDALTGTVREDAVVVVVRSFGDCDVATFGTQDSLIDVVVDHTGAGVESLRSKVVDHFRTNQRTASVVSERQYQILTNVAASLHSAAENIDVAELAAEHIYEARAHLSVLMGKYDRDKTLASIFSTFCVGK